MGEEGGEGGGSLSAQQEKVIALLPQVPGLLSLCSCIILIRLLYKAHFRSPYRRILFALSAVDIPNTLRICLGPFLVPKESRRIWSVGNANTCQFMGVLTQLTMPTYVYYSFLSIYFVLFIKYHVRDTYFARYIEPFVHVFCCGYAIITAIIGVSLHLIGENKFGNGCWINGNPDIGCGERCAVILQWVFGAFPYTAAFLVIVISHGLIVTHVWSTMQKTRSKSLRGWTSRARQLRLVTTQALLYITVYYMVHVWTFSIRIMAMAGKNTQDEASIYWLLVLRSTFHPLMGFGNLLVYVRPRYIQMRYDYPQQSWYWAIKTVLTDVSGGDEADHKKYMDLNNSTRNSSLFIMASSLFASRRRFSQQNSRDSHGFPEDSNKQQQQQQQVENGTPGRDALESPEWTDGEDSSEQLRFQLPVLPQSEHDDHPISQIEKEDEEVIDFTNTLFDEQGRLFPEHDDNNDLVHISQELASTIP